ncbi:MAG: hypothetical protein ACKOA8_18690 [Deltaproteobacteria bacterium]|jgi:hypothetical protein
MRTYFLSITFLVVSLAWGETTGVKIDDVKADTAIVVKKGTSALGCNCTTFEIIDGNEEITGVPEYQKRLALSSWQKACEDWKKGMKELNVGNQIIALSCHSPQQTKDGENNYLYISKGTYKIRVKVKEETK